MTKKLEELLGLDPIETTYAEDVTDYGIVTKDQAMAEAAEVMSAISNSEKIDIALTTVTGLLEHDADMDDIAKRALKSYSDLCSLGQNVPDMHTGKIYEVAATMLKTAMEAKDAKVQKKLKMLDLQIRKMKVDSDKPGDNSEISNNNTEFDRNELLSHILNASRNSEESDK